MCHVYAFVFTDGGLGAFGFRGRRTSEAGLQRKLQVSPGYTERPCLVEIAHRCVCVSSSFEFNSRFCQGDNLESPQH